MHVQVSITHKLFHNSEALPLATLRLHVSRDGTIKAGALNKLPELESQPDYVKLTFAARGVVLGIAKDRCAAWIKDKQFCITWDENSCLEMQFKDVS